MDDVDFLSFETFTSFGISKLERGNLSVIKLLPGSSEEFLRISLNDDLDSDSNFSGVSLSLDQTKKLFEFLSRTGIQ